MIYPLGLLAIAASAMAVAVPQATTAKTTTSTKATTTAAATTSAAAGNPFAGKQLYANAYYSSEVINLAVPSLPASLKAAASAVAKVPSFYWMDTHSKVPVMGTMLDQIAALNAAGASPPVAGIFVVYDLPDRDCAALASNGEYSTANNGLANYKSYINDIATQIKAHSKTSVILVIEPDSLGNLVTNLGVQKCANAQQTYLTGIEYALSTLNLPNVAVRNLQGQSSGLSGLAGVSLHAIEPAMWMYMDAGHAGWLGWQGNLQPAADLFAKVYKAAGSPAAVRGLATNVANYNAWSIATCPSYTSGNANCDEKRYVNALAPLLIAEGFPAHFITDTGRDGVQPTQQQAWGDWCNVKGTGFGVRPTTATGDPLEDAFVWVKPGGEGDGTSNSSSPRYDAHCGYSDALTPAPEAGTWFEAYFQQLLQNANPKF